MTSKKRLDFLFTDKEPFLLLERSIVALKSNSVVSISEAGGIETIPVAGIAVLVLGNGSSITNAAAIQIAKEGCHLAFSRGALNIHSHFISNKWYNPEPLLRQVTAFSNPEKRLIVAKSMFLQRQRISNDHYLSEKIPHVKTHEELLGIEGAWSRRNYAIIAKECGIDFKRDNQSIIGPNGRISVLNNLLYHYFTSLALSIGYNPSLGFIHGLKRRGGLSFDLADIYKHEIGVKLAMREGNSSTSKLMRELSKTLMDGRSKIAKDTIILLENLL